MINSPTSLNNKRTNEREQEYKYMAAVPSAEYNMDYNGKEWNRADDLFFNTFGNSNNMIMPKNETMTMDEITYLHMLNQHNHLNLELESNLGDTSDTKSFTPSPILGIENLESDMMLLSTPNPDLQHYNNDLLQYIQPNNINKTPNPSTINSLGSNINYILNNNDKSNEDKTMNSVLSPIEYEELMNKTNEWKNINVQNHPNHLLLNNMMNQYNIFNPNMNEQTVLPYNLQYAYFNNLPYYSPTMHYMPNFEGHFITNNPHHNSFEAIKVKRNKNVGKACTHCKKAHLACDESRPCKRCTHLGKTNCIDVEHKRRGRPKSSTNNKKCNVGVTKECTDSSELAKVDEVESVSENNDINND